MVTCPNCGQENPEGFRLCGMCGASLTLAPAVREAARGSHESEIELERALAFYRSVGTSHFVERGEALLGNARSA